MSSLPYGGTNANGDIADDAAHTISIGESAFTAYSNLGWIYCFDVGKIGANAFNGCTQLLLPSFPRAQEIGDNAFANCPSLVQVVVGGGNWVNPSRPGPQLERTGLPQALIDVYNKNNRKGGYERGGTVTYYKNADGTWSEPWVDKTGANW